jgi:hypothetical protein
MLTKSSPLKLLGQMEPNLAGSIYHTICFCIVFLRLVYPKFFWIVYFWLPLRYSLTFLYDHQSSPLKLLGQMEPNLAGSIYVRSSIKLLHLIPFGQQTWPLLLKIEHMVKLHVFGNNSMLSAKFGSIWSSCFRGVD